MRVPQQCAQFRAAIEIDQAAADALGEIRKFPGVMIAVDRARGIDAEFLQQRAAIVGERHQRGEHDVGAVVLVDRVHHRAVAVQLHELQAESRQRPDAQRRGAPADAARAHAVEQDHDDGEPKRQQQVLDLRGGEQACGECEQRAATPTARLVAPEQGQREQCIRGKQRAPFRIEGIEVKRVAGVGEQQW